MSKKGTKIIKRESRSIAGKGGGTEQRVETGKTESVDIRRTAQHCHTFTASSERGTAHVTSVALLLHFFFTTKNISSVSQLQERVLDLEEERNLLKKSYDSLLER